MSYVIKAKNLATKAHAGQQRWGGEPYIAHPQEIAERLHIDGYTERYVIVAWLHDVVEDTNVTLDDLEKEFPAEIVYAVDAITKRNEPYSKYIERVAANDIARKVKEYDIKHNLENLKKGSMKDKYMLALAYFELHELYCN